MSLSINWINMIPLAKTFPEIFERSMIQYLKLKVIECSGCRLKVRSNMCSPGGFSWEFLVGVPCAARFSKSWPDFRPKSVIVRTRFQTCPLGGNYIIITQIGAQTNEFFKSISNSHISLSFLLVWNWNDKYVHTLLKFPRKPHPITDQNYQRLYPFSDQNGAKTLSDGAAHIHMAYIREYPPGMCRHLNFSSFDFTI